MHPVLSKLRFIVPVTANEFVCPNPACASGRWLVSCPLSAQEVWLVAAADDSSHWRIAAPAPICPLCGADLVGVPAC